LTARSRQPPPAGTGWSGRLLRLCCSAARRAAGIPLPPRHAV